MSDSQTHREEARIRRVDAPWPVVMFSSLGCLCWFALALLYLLGLILELFDIRIAGIWTASLALAGIILFVMAALLRVLHDFRVSRRSRSN